MSFLWSFWQFTDMITGVNTIGGNASKASSMWMLQAPTEFRVWGSPELRHGILEYRGHLDLLKTDLNTAKIITFQNQ